MAYSLESKIPSADKLLEEQLFPLFREKDEYSRKELNKRISASVLDAEEKTMLYEFADNFGKNRLLKEETESCRMLSAEFSRIYTTENEDSRKKAKMYLNFGFLGGALGIILLF